MSILENESKVIQSFICALKCVTEMNPTQKYFEFVKPVFEIFVRAA